MKQKADIERQKADIEREHQMNLHQEKVNNSQARHIKDLEKVVDKFDDIRKDMDMKISKLDQATLDNTVQIGR